MDSIGNGSDTDYRSQLPVLYNNNSFCRNFTEGNTTKSFTEALCDGDREVTGGMDEDANPVIIAIVITALYSIVCVVGLVGNVLVMYIIVSHKTFLSRSLSLCPFDVPVCPSSVRLHPQTSCEQTSTTGEPHTRSEKSIVVEQKPLGSTRSIAPVQSPYCYRGNAGRCFECDE
ncbi:Mu-type opioid receptor [Channa argus]|uniref:Mu-type opioid receptor n=1 Tax=Channa argus TaxID=215402 RepID=A0A6G1R041_CHAAH|nr:Mu-type opioid receptor [Channa argus]